MKQVILQNNWLESWKYSYPYDLLEIYGDRSCKGYAYAYENRYKHTLEFIKKVAKPGAKILDVAAAQGNFSLRLAELGYEVTWNDIREDLIDYVKLKWEYGKISFAPGNICTLNFNSIFDVVLISEVIEHVAHPDEFLRKVAQTVKPGGYIVMSTPNGEYIQNRLPKFSECQDASSFEAIQFKPNSDGHIFLLHLDEIVHIASKLNLDIVEIKLVTNPLTNGHIKLHHFLKILPEKLVKKIETFTTYFLPFFIKRKLHNCTVALFQKREK